MWLDRFLDSILPGLVPFMACLLALVVYDIIKIFIQRGWSFGVLFRPAEYYYLSILHSRAKEKLLSGTDKEDIVRSLRQEKYPFMVVPPKDEKTVMALSFVERVLADDDALKQYLVKYDFSYDDFKDLQKAMESEEGTRRANYLWDEILTGKGKEQAEKIRGLVVHWMTEKPIAEYLPDDNLPDGKNEKILMLALKNLSVIHAETSQVDFVEAVLALAAINPGMRVVKTKGNLSYYRDIHNGSQEVKQAEGIIGKLLNKS